MAVAAKRINPKRTLLDAARDCIEQAKGDRYKAAKLFRREVDEDGGLRRELIEPLLEKACWEQIRRVAHVDRKPYWSSTVKTGNDNTSGIASVAKKHAQDWLSYPLSCGKVLGDANRDEVDAERALHEMNARTNAVRARFYGKIVDAMGSAKRVRDALTNDKLDELSLEVSHA